MLLLMILLMSILMRTLARVNPIAGSRVSVFEAGRLPVLIECRATQNQILGIVNVVNLFELAN